MALHCVAFEVVLKHVQNSSERESVSNSENG
jgi:hypothetical protein